MTREEFQTYQTLTKKFSEYCNDIFSYIKKNYARVLYFGEYSEFSNAKCYPNDVTFEYYDSHDFEDFESSIIEIPINDFLTDPYKWADEWAKAYIGDDVCL